MYFAIYITINPSQTFTVDPCLSALILKYISLKLKVNRYCSFGCTLISQSLKTLSIDNFI